MQILQDKFFDKEDSLVLESKTRESYDILMNEVRYIISNVFTKFNDLIAKGEDDIFNTISRYFDLIKLNNSKGSFISGLHLSYNKEKNLISISGIFYDKDIEDKLPDNFGNNDLEKKYVKSFSTRVKAGAIGTSYYYDYDRITFYNMEDFEDMVSEFIKIKHYILDNIHDFERFENINLKYNENQDLFIKPLYMKGDFLNGEQRNSGWLLGTVMTYFSKLEDEGVIKILHSTLKTKNEGVRNILNFELKSGERIGINLIDENLPTTLVTMSVSKDSLTDNMYEFINDCYLKSKDDVIKGVKGDVHDILLNFSSQKTNIINQYNYWSQHKQDEYDKNLGIKKIINREVYKKLNSGDYINYSLDGDNTLDINGIMKIFVNHERVQVSLDGIRGEIYDFINLGYNIGKKSFEVYNNLDNSNIDDKLLKK